MSNKNGTRTQGTRAQRARAKVKSEGEKDQEKRQKNTGKRHRVMPSIKGWIIERG